MELIKNIKYGNDEATRLDAYLPDKKGFTTIVCFHGGGLERHGKDTPNFVDIANDFVKAGYAFVSADYRIYPEAKFPDFICDAAKAIAYTKSKIAEWGGSEKIIVTGQSAGAWISLMLCLDKTYLNAEGIDPLEIEAWIIDSAQTTAHFNVLKYDKKLNSSLQRIDETAPLYFIDENTAFTKMLLIVYENDMPCRYEQNMLFYKAVLNFNGNANISYKVLSGAHCSGSSIKGDNGEYAYVKTALKWLRTANVDCRINN